THRGAVGHDRLGPARDVLVLLLDAQDDVDALAGQPHVADLADGDAAVGHLRAGEDAAGLAEVRGHGVRLVEDEPVEARVAGADERDPDHRDEGEDHELDLGAPGDHRCTIPHTRRAPRSDPGLFTSPDGTVEGPKPARPRPGRVGSPGVGTGTEGTPGTVGTGPRLTRWHTREPR